MPDPDEQPKSDGAIAVHYRGQDTYVTPEQYALENATAEKIDPVRASEAAGHQVRAERSGGLGGAVKAGVGSFIGGSTMGLVNPFEEEQEFNPVAAGLGTVASYAAPFLLPGGAEAKAAEALAEPSAAEHIAGAMSSKFLQTGEHGATTDAGKALESSLSGTGKKVAGEIAEEGAERSIASQLTPERINQMSAPELKQARAAEIENIKAQRKADAVQLVKDLGEHRDASWMPLDQADAKAIVGETSGQLSAADRRLRNVLDNPVGLARRPQMALDALERQGTALASLAEDEPELRKLFAGDETGARAAKLDQLAPAIQRNQELQARVQALLGPEKSSTLEALDAAKDALREGGREGKEGIAQQLLGGKIFEAAEEKSKELFGGIPFIGPVVGSKAAELAKSLLFGHGAEAIGEGMEGAAKVAKEFASRAIRGPGAPITASKILAGAAFAPAGAAEKAEGEKGLERHFDRVSKELKSQTMYGPMGAPVMRPEARAEMAKRLDPLRIASPRMADGVETIQARRVEFLSSKLPRCPDLPGMGPGVWKPSSIQMRTFARYVDAVEHPENVEQRLLSGTVTPEDAEAYQAVYPERHAQLTQMLLQEMATSKERPSYARRVSMSIFTGQPCDPSLDPLTIATFQSHFAKEQGSQGGSSNPAPSPQFGSVKRSAPEPTPGDKRAQGVG